MKSVIRFFLAAGMLLLSLSCSKTPNPVMDEETSRFVGMWSVTSDNPDAEFAFWVLYDDGTAKKIQAEGEWEALSDLKLAGVGKWTYSKDSGILATTVDLFQVQVTMSEEKEWSAIGTDGKYHYTAKTCKVPDLTRLYLIFMGTVWTGEKYGSFSIGDPLFAYWNKNGSSTATALSCSMPSGLKDVEPSKWNYLWINQFSGNDNKIGYSFIRKTLGIGTKREYYFEGTGSEMKAFELTGDPLSPSSCRLYYKVVFTEDKGVIDGLHVISTRTYEDTCTLGFPE